MAVYFAIFQILPTFVYELFETMQSSVTRSKTSITKSLPASFNLSIFTLFSEGYNKIHCFSLQNCVYPVKSISERHPIGKREVGYLLQTLHVTDNRILLTGLFRFEVELKSTYQFTIDF